jgi:hypothetical protein
MNEKLLSQIEKDFNGIWFNKKRREIILKDSESISLLRKLFMEKELDIIQDGTLYDKYLSKFLTLEQQKQVHVFYLDDSVRKSLVSSIQKSSGNYTIHLNNLYYIFCAKDETFIIADLSFIKWLEPHPTLEEMNCIAMQGNYINSDDCGEEVRESYLISLIYQNYSK